MFTLQTLVGGREVALQLVNGKEVVIKLRQAYTLVRKATRVGGEEDPTFDLFAFLFVGVFGAFSERIIDLEGAKWHQ